MVYVKRRCYEGIDYHDAVERWVQLKENGKFEINNLEDVIVKDVLKMFPYLDKEKILDAIHSKTVYKFDVKNRKKIDKKLIYEDCETFIFPDGTISYENEGSFNGKDFSLDISQGWGNFYSSIIYDVSDIKPEKLRYLVLNSFYHLVNGCPIIDRIYKKPFYTLDEAKEYLRELNKGSYYKFRNKWKNEKHIMVFDIDRLSESNWYKENILAIELMDEKKQTIYNDSFHPLMEVHLDNLNNLK